MVEAHVARVEPVYDAHAACTARARMLWCFCLLGLGVGCLDGIDWDEGYCEQFADTCDIAGAGLAGEEAVVADAVEARWQDMHQEAADKLVGIERHHLVVSFGAL